MPIVALDNGSFAAMLKRLVEYQILQYNPETYQYTTHPLIRNHYLDVLNSRNREEIIFLHGRIKDYYLTQAADSPEMPTLNDIIPLIEAVHHSCQAEAYDEAYELQWERVEQGNRWIMISQLGAYDTELTVMRDFFPGGDTSQDPLVSKPNAKVYILNQVGYSTFGQGRMNEALPFLERGGQIALQMEDWFGASVIYRNLVEVYAYRGSLPASAETITQALNLARRANNRKDEGNLLAYQGWIAHLRGDLATADVGFRQAEEWVRKDDLNMRYLSRQAGIQHATHLRRIGDISYARQITEANLEICERNRYLYSVSQCHRVLGDLDADLGDNDKAQWHYDEAVKIARGTSQRNVLIEILLARGRWHARNGRNSSASSDLNEALSYSLDGGARLYEVDIRIGLSWMYSSAGDVPLAHKEAKQAQTMSAEMDYYWAKVDATKILEELKNSP